MMTDVPPPPPKQRSKALRPVLFAGLAVVLVAGWMVTSVLIAKPGRDPSVYTEFPALAASAQPDPSQPNRYAELIAAVEQLATIVEEVRLEAEADAQSRAIYDFDYNSAVEFEALAPRDETEPSEFLSAEAIALRDRASADALARLEESGVFDRVAEVLTHPNLANPYQDRTDAFGETNPLYLWSMPELGNCRNYARAQVARTRLAREAGDTRAAATLLADIAPLPAVFSRQSTIIEHLVGYAIGELVLDEIRALATDPGIDAEALDTLRGAVRTMASLNSPALAFDGERLGSRDAHYLTHSRRGRLMHSQLHSFMSTVGIDHHAIDPSEAMVKLGDIRGYAYASREDSLALFEEYYTLLTTALNETNAVTRQRLMDEGEVMLESLNWRYPLAQIALPALGSFVEQWFRFNRSITVTETIVAMADYRLDTGDWPTGIAPLIPDYVADHPTDPVTGEPLEYRHEPDEALTVESFGETR